MKRYSIYIIFVLFIAFISYLGILAKKFEPEYQVQKIIITNNQIIPDEMIYDFISIKNSEDLKEIPAKTIIDRIEKIPYVKNAEGRFVDLHTFQVFITEIEPFIMMITKQGSFIISKDGKILPDDKRLRVFDLPILTVNNFKLANGSKMSENPVIKNAFNAFLNIDKIDDALFEVTSELNIDTNSDLVLFLTKPKGKILIGKSLDKFKALYFSEFWRNVVLKNSDTNYDYIDLRFEDQIVIKTNSKNS